MLFLPQTAYKLLELYVRLRELGHPEFIRHDVVTESLACAVDRGEADGRVGGVGGWVVCVGRWVVWVGRWVGCVWVSGWLGVWVMCV